MQAARGRIGPIYDCGRRFVQVQFPAENQSLLALPARGSNHACPQIRGNASAASSQTHRVRPTDRVHGANPNLLAAVAVDLHFLFPSRGSRTPWERATIYDNSLRKNRMIARLELPESSLVHARHRSW